MKENLSSMLIAELMEEWLSYQILYQSNWDQICLERLELVLANHGLGCRFSLQSLAMLAVMKLLMIPIE